MTPCVIGKGKPDGDGYCRVWVDGKNQREHRVAWESVNGPIPAGLVIDHHVCYNHACVNVEHMKLATRRQNTENREGLNANNKSGYRGVTWFAKRRKWRVRVVVNRVAHTGGLFTDVHEAGRVAAEMRRSLMSNSLRDRVWQP